MKKVMNSSLNVHIAVLLFGFAGILGEMIPLPATALTFGRVLFSTAGLGLYLGLRRQDIRLENRREYLLMAIAGALLAVHWVCFMQSVKVSTVAIATVSVSTVPLFTTFLEPLIYKEKLKLVSIAEAVAMLIGVLIMVDIKTGLSSVLGVAFGLTASFVYAVLSLMNRRFSAKYSGLKVCLYEQGVAGLVLLPVMFIIKPVVSGRDILLLLVLGILCTAVAQSLFVMGLRRIKVQTAGVICGMEPVYGIILAIFLVGQIPSTREILGCVVVLAVTAFTTVRAQKSVKPSSVDKAVCT